MMLVGHIIGRMSAQLRVSSSGDRLWSLLPDDRRLPAAKRARLRRRLAPYLQFSPMPQADSEVFLAAPQRGTPTARHRFLLWATELIRLPPSLLREMASIFDSLKDESAQGAPIHLPNGAGNLSDTDPFIAATAKLPISTKVRYRSIICLYKTHGGLAHCSDGVVPYASTHLAGAASEVEIPAWHRMREAPAAIL